MNEFEKIIDRIKVHAVALYREIDSVLNTAYPDVVTKRIMVGAFIAIELMIAYIIAMFDIGMKVGDVSLWGMIAAYWNERRFYPLLTFLIVGGLLAVVAFFYLKNFQNGNTGRGFTIADSNVYGSAREINMDELEQVAEVKPKEAAMGMILGQLDETETKLITQKNIVDFNKNFLCMAPPGSGKTATIVLNAIVQAIRRGESIITTDTKGEIWAKTVELARLHGYIVRRFDLKNPHCSDGWDVLGEIRMDVDRAGIIANIIMANTSAVGERDIHAGAEESLLTALCLYIVLDQNVPPEEKTLYNAYTMLFQGPEALDSQFNTIQDDPIMRPAYEYYTGALQGSNNLRTNVVAGLAKRLSPLSNPPIRELTSTPDIELDMPGLKKCIYYVEMNDQVNNKRFLSSLFFSFVFLDLCDLADNRDDLMLPVPVNVIIEEMYACGYLPTVTNALSTVRSRGIAITMIAQGIDQFYELYGDNTTNTILNSCATQACLGANSRPTAEHFEWLGGQATVDVKTEQHEVLESPIPFGRRYSTGFGRQHLFTSNDVRKIPPRHILLVWQRFDPIMTHTFFYKRHPEYLNGHMPEISGRVNVPLADKEARAMLRAREEQRVENYEAWIARGGNPWKGYLEPVPDGPTSNEDLPEIIPYPELEKMVLAHSEQARDTRNAHIMEELQKKGAVPAPKGGFDPAGNPADYADNGDDGFEDLDDEEDSLDLDSVYAPTSKREEETEETPAPAPQDAPHDPKPVGPDAVLPQVDKPVAAEPAPVESATTPAADLTPQAAEPASQEPPAQTQPESPSAEESSMAPAETPAPVSKKDASLEISETPAPTPYTPKPSEAPAPNVTPAQEKPRPNAPKASQTQANNPAASASDNPNKGKGNNSKTVQSSIVADSKKRPKRPRSINLDDTPIYESTDPKSYGEIHRTDPMLKYLQPNKKDPHAK